MLKSTLLALLITLIGTSCAHNTPQNTETTTRAPASVGPSHELWGEKVTDENQQFIDELENAPAGKYD